MFNLLLSGRQTTTPQYGKVVFSTRAAKDSRLNIDSKSYYRGLHESWEWYDKCAKRSRNQGWS